MEKQKEKLKTIPGTCGVYLFSDSTGNIIYVGKAVNLLRRVTSYFTQTNGNSTKILLLQREISDIKIIPTVSEFDAILLEAKLIRKYSPRYNVIAKDDKSPIYIKITLGESLPHIFFVRKSNLEEINNRDIIVGPFKSARVARSLIHTLRMAIPFCLQKKRDGCSCFYTHLGLCNPCPSYIDKLKETDEKKILTHKYRKNIQRLVRVLQGKSREVLAEMDKTMRRLASENNFEMANQLKTQIESLYTIHMRHHDPVVYDEILQGKSFSDELNELARVLKPYFPLINGLTRIECIDISNLDGKLATGSLVVLEKGYPKPSDYRRFRIKMKNSPNDTAMVAHVLTRRLRHNEWPIPDLLVIDGGKPQARAAFQVLQKTGKPIPVIGLAKRLEVIIVPKLVGFSEIKLSLDNSALHIIQRIRDEAHRFARSYHLLLRHLRTV